MNTVIMGCGRVGARVASILENVGHSVSIIDVNPLAFRRLPAEFGGDTVIGTGVDEDVLRSAGIADADVFIAVTNEDNRNIMAAQVAKVMFDVPEIVVRIYDPVRHDTFRRLGMATICPTVTISAMIVDHVTGVNDGLLSLATRES